MTPTCPPRLISRRARAGNSSSQSLSSICPPTSKPRCRAYLADRAKARGIDVAQLVNELLKKDIELIEATPPVDAAIMPY